MTDTITGFTAARMQLIENAALVSAEVVGGDLIFTRFDTTTFNAGEVVGPEGPPSADGNPAGTIIMGGWGTAPAGYLFLGQTIVGGVATYPALAAMYPSWVSGGNLVIPNADGSVPMQGSPMGVVSGSMTHTLSSAQLAAYTHTGPSHVHAGPSHSHQVSLTSGGHSATHTHSVSGNTATDAHTHTYVVQAVTGAAGNAAGSTTSGVVGTTGSDTHSHGVSLTSGSASASHTHSVSGDTDVDGTGNTGSAGTGATGSTGTGATINHTPKNLTVRYAVKT